MPRFAPRLTRPMCWRKPCSFSSRLWRLLQNRISQLEAAAQQGAEQPEEQGSFLGNLGKSIFGAGPSSPPPRPYSDPRAAPSAARLRAARASRRLSPAAPAGLSASTGPVGPASAAFGRRRVPAERGFNARGGRRCCAWQSAGRPVWRPWRWRRRSLWRGKRHWIGRVGPDRQRPDGDHRDQQLLRRQAGPRRRRELSSSSIPARRASRTRTSTTLTTRPSTTRTGRPTMAAATTTSEVGFDLDGRRGVLRALAVFVLEHHDRRPDGHAIVKVDHILVHHPDAA